MSGEKVIRELHCSIDKDALLKLGAEMSETIQDVAELEAEKSESKKSFDTKISKRKKEIMDIAAKIQGGTELREIPCKWVFDWENNTKELVRTDTDEVIEETEIEDKDREQTFLDNEEEKTAEEEVKLEEVTEGEEEEKD